ncbi:hypothetical protein M2267_001658 [Ensifer sp. KUDG1]|uniref:hypothetical protein n=1 Tax=unclassified Ensifer TaxID=2633371 RepID=UPI0005BDA6DC|nr:MULTISPECIES: hypothetical protein [unclassified Ensifer]MBD9647418.1 hypothetical protein [Ensifer sp. ENS09]QRY68724.1 hypothetical protein JVX98_10770 [Ensifer sp. PDNC004]
MTRSLRLDAASLWFEAPFVIAVRLQEMQMAALTGKSQDVTELQRMISEKIAATAESVVAVNVALWKAAFDNTIRMMTGATASGHGTAIASAALRPYGKRVRSNARRLQRKKP